MPRRRPVSSQVTSCVHLCRRTCWVRTHLTPLFCFHLPVFVRQLSISPTALCRCHIGVSSQRLRGCARRRARRHAATVTQQPVGAFQSVELNWGDYLNPAQGYVHLSGGATRPAFVWEVSLIMSLHFYLFVLDTCRLKKSHQNHSRLFRVSLNSQ